MSQRQLGRVIVAVMLTAIVSACRPQPPSASSSQLFADITAQSGVDFEHRSGLDGSFRIAQIMGSGLAVFDADNDTDLDLFFVNGQSLPNRLFIQVSPGQFEDRTDESGLGDTGNGMGAAIGDIDNDGDIDLFVSNVGADRLYRNDGAGRFTDISNKLDRDPKTWSTSAAMFDYDRDGDLDIYVAGYIDEKPPQQCRTQGRRPDFCAPAAYPGVADRLLRNDGVVFADVSTKSGLTQTQGRGLGLAVHDFDGNGWPDIFVANDGEANNLWLNSGEGFFEDHAVRAGVAYNMFGKPEASMGVALGDTDGNGSLDLFVTHLSTETNTLYGGGGGNMLDKTAASGLGAASLPYTGFGTAMFDVELDGDLDIAVANGRVTLSPEHDKATADEQKDTAKLAHFITGYGEPDQVFVNDGSGRFEAGCPGAGPFCNEPSVARGLLAIDIDSDGDLDLLITRSNGSARIYRNDAPRAGDWLTVRVLDRTGSHDAIGAIVELSGARSTQIRLVRHSSSYLSSADARVHFGVPPQYAVTGMTVTWPDGERERFEVPGLNRQMTVQQGSGASIP